MSEERGEYKAGQEKPKDIDQLIAEFEEAIRVQEVSMACGTLLQSEIDQVDRARFELRAKYRHLMADEAIKEFETSPGLTTEWIELRPLEIGKVFNKLLLSKDLYNRIREEIAAKGLLPPEDSHS